MRILTEVCNPSPLISCFTGKLEDDTETAYNSTAQLLLVGMGADEQLGGYSRHRGIYLNNNCNMQALRDEIDMEVERISSRNLGRDDRFCFIKE